MRKKFKCFILVFTPYYVTKTWHIFIAQKAIDRFFFFLENLTYRLLVAFLLTALTIYYIIYYFMYIFKIIIKK